MNERRILRTSILSFWTLFWGLSVLDKIIPDVHFLWVGKDFFALFVKFFGSLGLSDPLFATLALAAVSGLESVNFTFYVAAMVRHLQRNEEATDRWFFRAILTSLVLFTLFSIADQVFGDRFQLLEHSLFWMVLIGAWWGFHALHLDTDEKRALPQKGMLRRAVGARKCLDFGGLRFRVGLFQQDIFQRRSTGSRDGSGRGCVQIRFPISCGQTGAGSDHRIVQGRTPRT